MPYKKYGRRNYNRRRGRFRSRKPWYKKKYSAMEVASKAWSAAKWLKSMVNVERKVLQTTNNTSISTVPAVTHLSAIPQGDTQSQREGNSVKAIYLGIRSTITCNISATSGSFNRIVVVLDTQQVGDTSPSWSDVFTSPDARSFLNPNTLGRFKILYDKVHNLTLGGNYENKYVEINIPLQHHLRYNGTASSDIQKGGLYYMVVGDQGTNTTTHNMNSRLRYVDN